MKITVIMFCLMGAVFANPILYKVVLEPSGQEANMTLSSSAAQSSESDTSELQSSEENTSNQSSESESSESTSEEDKTSEENDSQSQSLEDRTSTEETRDNSMASEENIRKGWISVFANVVRVLSAEDNSTEDMGQPDRWANKHTKNQLYHTPTSTDTTAQSDIETDSQSDETSQDSQSSESTSSESSENSETSDSGDTSESTESNASDSADVEAKNCQEGMDSADCESEERVFQDIGDDGYSSLDHLMMMPGEEHREFSLRR